MPYFEGAELDSALRIDGAKVGRLVGVAGDGAPLVDFDGNPSAPVVARVAVASLPNLVQAADIQTCVVLVFENGDPSRPLIVGVMGSEQDVRPTTISEPSRINELFRVELDGRSVVLEAREQVTLRCGAATLTLRNDGKVLLSGKDVTSWATRTNKIRGGSVRIN
jgi:hypothetical protein